MIDKDFPCKTCSHKASRHYISVCGGEGICLDCAVQQRPIYENEHWHDFVGDNFKYLELLNKREEIKNEQA